jgi:hypothetical protein
MIPAKARDLIPDLAAEIGIPEEDLANMLSFYFKENKRIASTLQANHIILRGLGTLNIKGWLLEEKIKQCDNPDNLPLFTGALTRWQKEKDRKRATGIKKKQFYDNKLINDESQTEGTTPDRLEE